MWTYNYTDELYHYGVPGMKWGKRRFQKKDGTLTNEGKKRYNDSENSNKEPNKKKSKHRMRLEETYMNQGMSREEAEKKADKRIKTEKVLAVTAAITVAAATAYAIRKNMKERTEQLIKAGDNMQRIEGQKLTDLHDSFFVTNNEYDNKNYLDAFGYLKKHQYGESYKLNIQATSDMKIASQKTAKDTLSKLFAENKEFREAYMDDINNVSNIRRGLRNKKVPMDKVYKVIKGEKVSDRDMKKIYDNFNSTLVGAPQSKSEEQIRNMYFEALKKKGYSGIQDINDLKWSNLRGKNPLIIFDKSKVKVTSIDNIVDKVSKQSSDKSYRRMAKMVGKQSIDSSMPKLATVSVSALAAATISDYAENSLSKKSTDKKKNK